MPPACHCDLVRDSSGGITLGGFVAGYVCNCPSRSITQITFQFTNRTGYFSSWPASVVVAFSPLGGCGAAGSVAGYAPDPGDSVAIEYYDSSPQRWVVWITSAHLGTTITTVTGLGGYETTTYVGQSTVWTTSLEGCDPSAVPGPVCQIVTALGDTLDVSTTVP